MTFSTVIGFFGATIAAYAYLPQIRHLVVERCSAGISIRAFGLWLTASTLITIHATAIVDPVFIFLGVVQVIATSLVLFFGHRYRELVCEFHLRHVGAADVPARGIATLDRSMVLNIERTKHG